MPEPAVHARSAWLATVQCAMNTGHSGFMRMQNSSFLFAIKAPSFGLGLHFDTDLNDFVCCHSMG